MTYDQHHLDPKLRASVAWQPNTPPEVLQALAQDPSVIVRQNVLRIAQQKEAWELLEIFLLDPDPVIRAELILWSGCPEHLLRRFNQDPNPALRGLMAHRLESAAEVSDANEVSENPPEVEVTTAPPDMLEQDEPTGGVGINGTEKLPPVAKEESLTPAPSSSGSAPKPVPVPTRTPTSPPLRSTPLPMRTPFAASPMPVRPSPLPLKSPMTASVPHHAPAPLPAPIAAPAREDASSANQGWPAPASTPAPMAAPSMPTLAEEDEPIEVSAPKVASPLPGKGEIRIQLTASDKSQSEMVFAKDLIVVGRVMGNDIVLAQGNVSKHHCRIFVFNDQLYVEDLKSTNGTQLNKNNVTPREPHRLLSSDELGIGSASLQISLHL